MRQLYPPDKSTAQTRHDYFLARRCVRSNLDTEPRSIVGALSPRLVGQASADQAGHHYQRSAVLETRCMDRPSSVRMLGFCCHQWEMGRGLLAALRADMQDLL